MPKSETTQRRDVAQTGSLAETLMVHAPAMVIALDAAGAFAETEQDEDRPLHAIESYGPVGFDFVAPDAPATGGPIVISEDVLEAVDAGHVDIELAMSVYWQDVPRVHAAAQPAWYEDALLGFQFDRLDDFDPSFGVAEQPVDVFFPEEDFAYTPIVDDFLI